VRIAIVTDFYYPALGGITEHVDGQARELTALGHEVTVVTGRLLQTPRVVDDAMHVPDPTFEIVRMGTGIRLYVPRWGNGAETLHTVGPRLGRRLGAFFRERGFDVVHVHAPYNPQMTAWAIENTPEDALSVAVVTEPVPAQRLPGILGAQEVVRGELAWSDPSVHDALDLCLSCKGCASDCPTGIDMATYKAEALYQRYRRRLRPRRQPRR